MLMLLPWNALHSIPTSKCDRNLARTCWKGAEYYLHLIKIPSNIPSYSGKFGSLIRLFDGLFHNCQVQLFTHIILCILIPYQTARFSAKQHKLQWKIFTFLNNSPWEIFSANKNAEMRWLAGPASPQWGRRTKVFIPRILTSVHGNNNRITVLPTYRQAISFGGEHTFSTYSAKACWQRCRINSMSKVGSHQSPTCGARHW